MIRTLSRPALVLVLVLAVAACGDDSSGSGDSGPTSEEAFCQAGDQLGTDVAGLTDIDLIAEGTDAVDAAFTSIRADTDALVADTVAFLDTHPVPQGAKQVTQHLERQRINAAFRSREARRFTADLGDR